jgi:hypothetical protein
MRLKQRFILPLLILMLLISYQNFSSVSPGEWDSERTQKIIKEMNEFNKNNPNQPALAVPQSGTDFKSVSSDWMDRQGHIFLNGYDKKLEDSMNEKLNSWVHEITKKDPMNEPNSSQPNAKADAGPGPSTTDENGHKIKQNFRFARINSLKYDVGEASSFNLTADPGNAHLDFSQTISSNSKLGLEHRSSDNQTQMIFKYEW